MYADRACGMYRDMERFAACSIAPDLCLPNIAAYKNQKTDRLKNHDV